MNARSTRKIRAAAAADSTIIRFNLHGSNWERIPCTRLLIRRARAQIARPPLIGGITAAEDGFIFAGAFYDRV